MATRRELIEAIAGRYHAAGPAEKKAILDEFIEVTGFHRKLAIRALKRTKPQSPSTTGPRSRLYDEAVTSALTIFREAADRICGATPLPCIGRRCKLEGKYGRSSIVAASITLILYV